MEERLQKIISAAGIASRRAAEQLILEGRVRVNGKVVTELGVKADAAKDHVKVDGKLINPRQPMTYIMLNKPAGFVTTMSDPEGRPTVMELLKGLKVRVYPVGRLDYNTEGLLLLTNDGDFAHLITHPKHEFPKTYRAKVKGVLEDRQIENLEQGIYLDDGKTAPAKLKKLSKEEANSWLEITIHEGKKRQVRRMFDRVGHSVIKLKRVKTGNLLLGDLAEGTFRHLTIDEVAGLKELAVKERKREVLTPKVAAHRAVIDKSVRTVEGSRKPGAGRSRTPDNRFAQPRRGAETGDAARRPASGTRVAGQGASGRGPRRPLTPENRPAQPRRSAETRDAARRPVSRARIPGQGAAWGGQRRQGMPENRPAEPRRVRGTEARDAARRPVSRTRIPGQGAAWGGQKRQGMPENRPAPPRRGAETREAARKPDSGTRAIGRGASGRGPRRQPKQNTGAQGAASGKSHPSSRNDRVRTGEGYQPKRPHPAGSGRYEKRPMKKGARRF